jgi:uncharacterized protein YebE (UPF0316 family)
LILTLLLIFGLNIISSTLGTLRSIFVTKKIMKPAYLVTLFDSLIFVYGLKMVTTGTSVWFLLAFAFGKVVGVYIGDKIEDVLAFGLFEVTVFAKKDRAIVLADSLRDLGYSVTTHKGFGLDGDEKFDLDIAIKRKELPLLKQILGRHGYDNATMVIREIAGVTGKISMKRSH